MELRHEYFSDVLIIHLIVLIISNSIDHFHKWLYDFYQSDYYDYSKIVVGGSTIILSFYINSGGGLLGGGGFFIVLVSGVVKLASNNSFPAYPHLLSLTYIGNPNSKSQKQVWHKFLLLAQLWHIAVLLYLPFVTFHLNTVNGLKQILHYCPYLYLSILINGEAP